MMSLVSLVLLVSQRINLIELIIFKHPPVVLGSVKRFIWLILL